MQMTKRVGVGMARLFAKQWLLVVAQVNEIRSTAGATTRKHDKNT